MGALCSRGPVTHESLYAKGRDQFYASGGGGYAQQQLQLDLNTQTMSSFRESTVAQVEMNKESLYPQMGMTGSSSSEDDFYDGIPRFRKSRSQKSRSRRSNQAKLQTSEMSPRSGIAGTLGLGKAADVLDNLGSSMANLNPGAGFASGGTSKGSELSILAFEVANTIVKGSSLMQSISKRNIRHLKEVVLPSEGVQRLVSNDMNELLNIVTFDKREELKIFAGEVVRFGNMCKDPQWHDLDRYFEKRSRSFTPSQQLKEQTKSVTQQLMILVQYTAELYHHLNALDRFEQDYQNRHQKGQNSNATPRGYNLAVLRADLKSKRKQVKMLKKKSLWCKSLEEVMEKLLDIVLILSWETHNAFGGADDYAPSKEALNNQQRLGPAGLSLHYANIVLQIDSIVARSNAVPSNARHTLYQNLPPKIKSSMRSKLQSFHINKELSVEEIKAEMEKTLHWLVPIATNTAKAHHGFGWVGEWANTRTDTDRKPTGPEDVIRLDTLHHADREKTEAYILELVLWLNYLVKQSKVSSTVKSAAKSPSCSLKETCHKPKHEAAASLPLPVSSIGDQGLCNKKRTRGISKSQDFNFVKNRSVKHNLLNKSSSYSPARGGNELDPAKRNSSGVPVTDSSLHREQALNVIDGVELKA